MIGRNNPLNIRYSPFNKWKGQSGQTRGFCNFLRLKFGIRAAAILLIRSYDKEGFRTYEAKIRRFAPSSENPTSNYVSYVTSKCKVSSSDKPLSIEDYSVMIYYMWCFEQGKSPTLSIADIETIISDFDLMLF